jgi:hypothetical protein
MPFFRSTISKKIVFFAFFYRILIKRGVAPPTYSRSARWRSFGASSQKFAEKTKFQKVLVKSAPLIGCPRRGSAGGKRKVPKRKSTFGIENLWKKRYKVGSELEMMA